MAAYGLLTTVHYVCAIVGTWVYVVKVPRGIGLQLGLQKLSEVALSAWALSQVTKVPRILGCAPCLWKRILPYVKHQRLYCARLPRGVAALI